MSFESFHFLRPAWLLAGLLIAPAILLVLRARQSAGRWRRVCDPELLAHLLVPGGGGSAAWPLALLAVGWLGASVALAGPTWQRLPQTTYEEPTQTIFALDLSSAMLENDVSPRRFVRARYELLDLLERAEGAAGLVIFAAEPYAVTPLTADSQVIAAQVPILAPDLMPGFGSRVDRAIDRAHALLEQAGAIRGRIVLVGSSAGDDPRAAEISAARAAAAGYPVSVLGVAGDLDALAALADAGGGRFAAVTAGDDDVDRVMAAGPETPGLLGSLEATGIETDVWQDMGAWLVLLPLALAPLAFRRRWAGALGVLVLAGVGAAPVARADAGDWFSRPDQRGARAFEGGEHQVAAELFDDAAWRSAAQYRAGDYEGAVQTLAGLDDLDARYNLGNALAHGGQLEEAIAAYERALELAPDHADALHNRDLIAKLLEEQQQEQEQQSPPQDPGDGEQDEREPSNGSDAADGERDESQSPNGSDGEQSESESSNGGDASEDADGGQDAAQSGADESETAEDATGSADDTSEEGGMASDSADDASENGDPTSAHTQPQGAEDGRGSEADPRSAGARDDETPAGADPATAASGGGKLSEKDQETQQWLNRVPDDPAGLLREKLRRRHAERRYGALQGGTR